MAIVLEKSGDKHRINLDKAIRTPGEIKINLDWSKGSFFKRMFGGDMDLDLGCFYEMRDGSKMLIDGLQFSHGRGGRRDQQTRQGCYTQAPYIWHRGDDRGGGAESGETILSILRVYRKLGELWSTLLFTMELPNGPTPML